MTLTVERGRRAAPSKGPQLPDSSLGLEASRKIAEGSRESRSRNLRCASGVSGRSPSSVNGKNGKRRYLWSARLYLFDEPGVVESELPGCKPVKLRHEPAAVRIGTFAVESKTASKPCCL